MNWFLQAGLALAVFMCPAVLRSETFSTNMTDTTFVMVSQAEGAMYGIFVQAPENSDCRLRQYAILTKGGRVLATSGVLRNGQTSLLRLGRPVSAGSQRLILRALGCPQGPQSMRIVRLNKSSPDYGNSRLVARSRHRDAEAANVVNAASKDGDPPVAFVGRTANPVEDRRRIKRHHKRQDHKSQ